ncbi:MAG: sigma-70 family RNA polymerase sigma factor [Planctomycetes bacterium]|nr:sigma-70 family RNA polymerase sigma factor [Planctomycetota bacterium]
MSMNDRLSSLGLDRLFDRFRRKGDVAALGAVFDRTASELLRVASTFVRDPAEAEDLVQATFLTAIERSDRYDSSRRLTAWLLGILVHHAHELRRKHAREIDPDRVRSMASLPSQPDAEVEARELSTEVERALASLSPKDRAILDAFLRDGKRAVDIAQAEGLAPGTVRMQIHRGLDRLRKALPAGLVGGAVVVAGGRGLAALRANVMQRAATTAASVSATGAAVGGGALLGGWIVSKKAVVVALGLALVAAILWLANPREARDAARPSNVVASSSAPAPAMTAPTATVTIARPAEASSVARAPSAFERALAGLTGRLVEHDGTPVPETRIALVEVRAELLADLFIGSVDPNPRPLDVVVATGVTDAEGRFLLRGARTLGSHALGIDLGGARGALKLIDAALHPGEVVDVGDVRLAATGSLSGRVVDELGRPVARARVRAAEIPSAFLELGATEVRGDSVLAWVSGPKPRVEELPPAIGAYEDRLPVATTRTDGEGRFALERVPVGKQAVVVDAPGFATLTDGPIALAEGMSYSMGDVAISRGLAVHGCVVAADGRGVARAEVCVGPLSIVRGMAQTGFAILQRCGRTDASGRFEAAGVRAADALVVAARDSASHPWATSLVRDASSEVIVTLEAASSAVVDVVDDEGAPVAGVTFSAHPDSGALAGGRVGQFSADVISATPDAEVHGRYRLEDLSRGAYALVARATDHAFAVVPLHVEGSAEPTRIVLPRCGGVEILVRDGRSGEPVADAEVTVQRVDVAVTPLEIVRTDADGIARIDCVVRSADVALRVRVAHPAYATASVPFDPTTDRHVVALLPGGELLARLRDGEQFTRSYVLVLDQKGPRGFPDGVLTRTGAFDSKGASRLSRLEPGRWTWTVQLSFGDASPLELLAPQHHSDYLKRGDVEIEEGETTEIEIVLDGEPRTLVDRQASAMLAGTVRINGEPAADVRLDLNPENDEGPRDMGVKTNRRGAYDFGAITPGRYKLIVRRTQLTETSGRLGEMGALEKIDLASGEHRQFDVDWTVTDVDVRVVRARGGEPVSGALVQLRPSSSGSGRLLSAASADGDGHAHVSVFAGGSYDVAAHHDERGVGKATIWLGDTQTHAELTVALDEGVECSGWIVADEGLPVGDGHVRLSVWASGDGYVLISYPLVFDGRRAPFRVVGLAPGSYYASVHMPGGQGVAVPFELRAGGSRTFEWTFVPRKDENEPGADHR